MNENVKKLLDLQDADRVIREKSNQVESIESRQRSLNEKIESIEKKEKRREEEFAQLKEESEVKNNRADELQDQIRKYEKRLDEGIISFKETEALKEKIEHTTDRLEELEDEAIDIMMEIDKLKQKRAEEKSKSTNEIDQIRSTIEDLEREKEQLASEIEEKSKERESIEEKIPDRLIKQYNRLKTTTHEPVVQIKNGVCQGCQMSVSKNTIKQARSDQGIATCENCSRILYIR